MAELLRQSSGRFAGSSEEQHSGNDSIEAVNDPQEHVARFFVFLLEVSFHGPVNGFFFSGVMRAQTPGRLGHRQAMVVFVQDFRQSQRHDE
jgi:hypothetical protein